MVKGITPVITLVFFLMLVVMAGVTFYSYSSNLFTSLKVSGPIIDFTIGTSRSFHLIGYFPAQSQFVIENVGEEPFAIGSLIVTINGEVTTIVDPPASTQVQPGQTIVVTFSSDQSDPHATIVIRLVGGSTSTFYGEVIPAGQTQQQQQAPGPSGCGDLICDTQAGETCTTCPQDCGQCI